jgi:hypothetical protein
MTNQERIAICMRERGYVVLSSDTIYPVGYIIDHIKGSMGGKTPQPMAIIKQTDRQDAIAQTEMLKRHGEDTGGVGTKPYFYRLSTY